MTVTPEWIQGQLNDVPEVLADVISAALAQWPDAAEASVHLLEESIQQGQSRSGAWPLLGADALATYLSAGALETSTSPERHLAALFHLYLDGP